MKILTFTLSITFSDKIQNDDEILEVANNVATALVRQAENGLIAPESSDGYTKSVRIEERFSGIVVDRNLV